MVKKVILNLAVSVDGFIEGPGGAIDWCIMDDDMNFDAFLAEIDTIFYGRVSYDAWGNFRPDEDASEVDRKIWHSIHTKNKFVFSRRHTAHADAAVISSDIEPRVRQIKAQGGKDIWLYGGANLITTFIDLNLIDVYKLSVHPVALGSGKALFENLKRRVGLKLKDTRVFKSGVVELTYASGI